MEKYLKEPTFIVLTDKVEHHQSVVIRIEHGDQGNYMNGEEVSTYKDLVIIQKKFEYDERIDSSSLNFGESRELKFYTANNINFAKIYGKKFSETLISFCKLRGNKSLKIVPCKLFNTSDK